MSLRNLVIGAGRATAVMGRVVLCVTAVMGRVVLCVATLCIKVLRAVVLSSSRLPNLRCNIQTIPVLIPMEYGLASDGKQQPGWGMCVGEGERRGLVAGGRNAGARNGLFQPLERRVQLVLQPVV
jgi:hypothetical protein